MVGGMQFNNVNGGQKANRVEAMDTSTQGGKRIGDNSAKEAKKRRL